MSQAGIYSGGQEHLDSGEQSLHTLVTLGRRHSADGSQMGEFQGDHGFLECARALEADGPSSHPGSATC